MKQLIFIIIIITAYITPSQSQSENFRNANPTRYIVGGTAYNLHQGTFLYKNTNLVLNTLTYGISNNFSLGVGTELLTPLLSHSSNRMPSLFIIAPKISNKMLTNVYISTGCEVACFPKGIGEDNTDDRINALISGYALTTFGTANNNLTVGIFTMGDDLESMDDVFIYNLGGTIRFGRSFSIIAECFYLPGNFAILDTGMRLFGRHSTVDFGMMSYSDFPLSIPVVDFAWKF